MLARRCKRLLPNHDTRRPAGFAGSKPIFEIFGQSIASFGTECSGRLPHCTHQASCASGAVPVNVKEILARLIAFPSVVGSPNGAIVDWVRGYCEAAGAEATVLRGPEGDRSNLFVTIGPRRTRGYILSGHMDVVPAGEREWN